MKTRLDETNKMRKLMKLPLLTETFNTDPQFVPIIGKTAIFKPIKDSTRVRDKGDGSEWNPYSEYSEKLSDRDAETLDMFTELKINGVIEDVLSHSLQRVEIKLGKMGSGYSTGLLGELNRVHYKCGERKFKLYFSPNPRIKNYNPETNKDEDFVFASQDKLVIVEATCDSLADYLESVLPCDAGHDFVKADSELDISDTLT